MTPEENGLAETVVPPTAKCQTVRKLAEQLWLHLRGRFVRNFLVVMSGTAVSQLIMLAVAPLLSRLFTPTDFGVAAAFGAILGFVYTPTLSYEQALMLPKDEKDGANLLGVAGVCIVGVSLLTGVVCVMFRAPIARLTSAPELAPWLWLAPLALFLSGTARTLTAWSTRQKAFHRASVSQVVRSATSASVQLVAGLQHASGIGLISGGILGDACSSTILATQVMRSDRRLFADSLRWSRMRKLAREYYEFPAFNHTKNTLNSLSQNVPVLLLGYFFGPAVVGFYAMGVRVLQVPINLVNISFSQVFFQKVSEVYNTGGNVHTLFRKATLGLIALIAPPTLLAMLFAPPVFAFVLGAKWWTAGVYARWLVLWLAVGFTTMPAQLCAQVYRKQQAMFYQNIAVLILRTGALLVGGCFFNVVQTIIGFTIVGVAYNISVLVWIWSVTRARPCPCAAE